MRTFLMKEVLRNIFIICVRSSRHCFAMGKHEMSDCFIQLSRNFKIYYLSKFSPVWYRFNFSFSVFVVSMNKNTGKRQRSSPLDVTTKEIVAKLYDFISKVQKNEIDIKSLISDVQNHEIIAKICSVSVRSVYRVLKERDKSGLNVSINSELDVEIESDTEDITPCKRKVFVSPKKRGPKSKRKIDIDDLTKDRIRHIIYDFHLTEQRTLTIAGLKDKINRDLNLSLGSTSLRVVIRALGFRWRKTKDNRQLLMEREDVVSKRIRYLRSIRKYRSEHRKIFYMDETYIHLTHTKKNAWSDDTNNGLRKPVSNKSKLIIVDAGNEEGFVPNARLIFRPEAKKDDYHDHMNFDNYEKWVMGKLLPNLPSKSVVVIDNAPYHNVQVEKVPNTSNTKDVIKQWLRKHDIPFEEQFLKAELLEIVKANKSRFFKYRIDKIFEDAGHNVLRLPPYHPTFNPIENIWGIAKGRVGARNVDFDVQSLIKITEEEFSNISTEEWRKTVAHALKEEQKYYERDVSQDDITASPIENDDFFISDSDTDDEIDVLF